MAKERRALRSKKLRSALWIHANGVCQICGCKLGKDWHADHIVPWCVTRRTNIHEMQALCPACNLKKGKKMKIGSGKDCKSTSHKVKRLHQAQMEEDAGSIAEEIRDDKRFRFRMLAHVVCGGGKSWLPGILMESMPSNIKLCWAVPRLALQSQAVEGTAKDFNLRLRDSGNDVDPSRGRRGVVVTHQAVSQNIKLWVDEFRRNQYILVIDEPHHAKISNSGERNALAAFIEAVEPHVIGLVYMTGTLSTGDSSKIYGIEYEQNDIGKWLPTTNGFDYVIRYKREDALGENAIVPIEFFHHDGPVKWECLKSGDTTEVMLSEVDRDEESNAIWTALSTQLAESLFERGYRHWKSNGNKLLVVCDSQVNAKRWHKELLSRGEKAFLAITEHTEALGDIKKFKSSQRSILVTCAMAYEGLDEKPLSHVIALTHIRSVPWIEQMLARVWRADRGKSTCYAFVTDDPRMQRVIAKIKSEEPDAKSDNKGTGGGGPGERSVAPVCSRHDLTRLSGLDNELPIAMLNIKQQQIFESLIAAGIDPSSEHLIGILKELDRPERVELDGSLSDKDLEQKIRQSISDHCRQIDRDKFNCEWGSMYKQLYKRNKKSIEQLDLSQLRRTLQYVESINT